MALRLMDHGLELLSRHKARAFFALAQGQPAAAPGEIPILVYNPHPYPLEALVEIYRELEFFSLLGCLKEIAKIRRGRPFMEWLNHTRNAELVVRYVEGRVQKRQEARKAKHCFTAATQDHGWLAGLDLLVARPQVKPSSKHTGRSVGNGPVTASPGADAIPARVRDRVIAVSDCEGYPATESYREEVEHDAEEPTSGST